MEEGEIRVERREYPCSHVEAKAKVGTHDIMYINIVVCDHGHETRN